MKGTSLELGLAAAFWAGLIAGSLLLVASFVAVPSALLLGGWALFLTSTAGAFALVVIASRREGVGVVRVLGRGARVAFGWIVAFLP